MSPNSREEKGTALQGRLKGLLPFASVSRFAPLWRRRRNVSVVEFAALVEKARELGLPLATREALTVARNLMRGLSPRAVVDVLGSAHGMVWLRRCFECVDVMTGFSDTEMVARHFFPGQNFEAYLRELFGRAPLFAVAAALRDGRPVTLPVAVAILRPTTLPTTGFHLSPDDGGALLYGAVTGPLVTRCRVVQLRGVDLPGGWLAIDPFDSWLNSAASLEETVIRAPSELESFESNFVEALRLLSRDLPDVLDELALAYQTVAPSRPRGTAGFPSGTTSTSLGFSMFAGHAPPVVLCEMLVHEVSHSHLFVVQDIDPLLDPIHHGSGWEAESFYSPWRDDPRPLNGLLHAMFVFSRVCRMWLRLVEKGEPPERDVARGRLAVLRLQLALAETTLNEHARWTPAGAAFFQELCREVDELARLTSELGLESATPFYSEEATTNYESGAARERQRAHFTRWRTRNPKLHCTADPLVDRVLGKL